MCLESGLPQRADLIILETMAMNDAEAVELLLLRLLTHFSRSMDAPPAFLLFHTHRMQTPGFDPTNCFTWLRDHGNDTACCEHFGDISFAPATTKLPSSKGDEMPEVQAGVMEFYGFGAIDHRAFLAALQRERVDVALKQSFCRLMGLLHLDSMHPDHFGRVLIADYLRAYLLEALLQLHAERRAAAAGAPVTPSAAVSALPVETMRVGLQPVAMRCYGFLGAQGASLYVAITGCARVFCCNLPPLRPFSSSPPSPPLPPLACPSLQRPRPNGPPLFAHRHHRRRHLAGAWWMAR
jgi:hypothetical protein